MGLLILRVVRVSMSTSDTAPLCNGSLESLPDIVYASSSQAGNCEHV